MIYSTANLANKYDITDPKFKTAFDFMNRKDLDSLPLGPVELEHGVRANIQENITKPAEEMLFETHEKYMDIHFIVSGEEKIEFCNRDQISVANPYSAEKDITQYTGSDDCSFVILRAGDFAFTSYEDAHKPNIAVDAPAKVRKIVFKIPV